MHEFEDAPVSANLRRPRRISRVQGRVEIRLRHQPQHRPQVRHALPHSHAPQPEHRLLETSWETIAEGQPPAVPDSPMMVCATPTLGHRICQARSRDAWPGRSGGLMTHSPAEKHWRFRAGSPGWPRPAAKNGPKAWSARSPSSPATGARSRVGTRQHSGSGSATGADRSRWLGLLPSPEGLPRVVLEQMEIWDPFICWAAAGLAGGLPSPPHSFLSGGASRWMSACGIDDWQWLSCTRFANAKPSRPLMPTNGPSITDYALQKDFEFTFGRASWWTNALQDSGMWLFFSFFEPICPADSLSHGPCSICSESWAAGLLMRHMRRRKLQWQIADLDALIASSSEVEGQ